MPNHPYDVETYNAALQSEVNKSWGIGIALLIVLIAMVVYSIALIKEDKTKKFLYVQFIGLVVLSVFLITSFCSTILRYSKDISEEAYIQYEGPATIRKRRIFGTWLDEYVISFNNNGEQVELTTSKNYKAEGDIENLYIVYAQNSGEILEFIE